MIITNIDKFLDFVLQIVEEETIIFSMHQNYVFIDRDTLKEVIKIAINSEDNFHVLPKIIKERYLQ